MDALKNFVPLLPVLLPLVGKILLMVPVVPNKAIPFINAAVATIAKYWFLAGFGTLGEVATPAPADTGMIPDTILMAGVLGDFGRGALSVVWGCLDSAMASYFYEGERAKARLAGKQTWLEKGKRSLF